MQITNCMSIYQNIKDFGKKALVVGGLVTVLSGCDQPTRVNQVLEDVNRDGRKDIVDYMFDGSVGWNGSHDIYVVLNNSDGTFADPKKVLNLKSRAIELQVEDLDGDKIPDISYVMFDDSVGWNGSWDMYSAKGKGDGTFQNPVKIRHYKSIP